MKLHLKPTHLATKAHKKSWFLYEMLRYKDYIKNTSYLKLILSVMIVMGCLTINGIVGIVLALVGLLTFDFISEFFIFAWSRDFLFDLRDALFDVETGNEHDLRILLNRVGNYIEKNKDEALYKEMVVCYSRLKFKDEITEAITELKKKV